MSNSLHDLLKLSAARHDHLCPRQVLGVRIGLAGLHAIGLEAPIQHKAAAGLHRDGRLFRRRGRSRHRRHGRSPHAAGQGPRQERGHLRQHRHREKQSAWRPGWISARPPWRMRPGVQTKYYAQLKGYQLMPVRELFSIHEVDLEPALERVLSRPGLRAKCARCGEEIINERQVIVEGETLCQTCAGLGYYQTRK